ncbi:MAG: Tn3 family transposase [Streptosporangiaceae bacterium]
MFGPGLRDRAAAGRGLPPGAGRPARPLGWRADGGADYGPLGTFARGKLDLGKVRRHWVEILRLTGSIYTSEVSAYDVVRALQRDGHPTALGEAIATYGRIFKTFHGRGSARMLRILTRKRQLVSAGQGYRTSSLVTAVRFLLATGRGRRPGTLGLRGAGGG